MATMPQLVLNKPGDAGWTEVAVPRLQGDGEALVRPVAVATCDLDTAINAGVYPMELPFAVGHEFVAEVVEWAAACGACAPATWWRCRFRSRAAGAVAACAGRPVTARA